MELTSKQLEAIEVLSGPAIHGMLFGGSRSGKTFLHVRNIILRALKAPKSRHCMLRFRLNHIKTSIMLDTFPKVMSLAFPDVRFAMHKGDFYVEFPDNCSEIWFGGLDDKERTEKILGNEYATILLNECSQISWQARCTVLTRLAQKVPIVIDGKQKGFLKNRMYYDCNPPNKGHWTYKVFYKKVDPETGLPLTNPDDYVSLQMNPKDNIQNLNEIYIGTLESLSPRLRKRFLDGEFADSNPNALFSDETIEKWRHHGQTIPEFVRVVVAVDPSGSGDTDNSDNDAIGIVVAALATDGNVYVLEDCTVKAGPATWGRIATTAYDRHKADIIVGEMNYGGEMVRHVIQTSRPRTPFMKVTASRGKAVRADPVAALYEEGKVRHVGHFRELEDELIAFSTMGYTGENSPNRADALIWAVTALFPGATNSQPRNETKVNVIPIINHFGKR